MKINPHLLSIEESYLFSTVARKVREHRERNSAHEIISLGIGDVTRPLAPAVVSAMQTAVSEMGHAETFRGYGEEQGYAFLREAIADNYAEKGVVLSADEIFVSDGAKSDLGNLLDLFSNQNTVLIPDPVYPVYRDTNLMAGRNIVYMRGTAGNGFLPMPDASFKADIIYLCSPNNPTGAAYSKLQLQKWVDYANQCDAVILFDAAYEAFIQDADLPRSIYEVRGATECAVEFCSFSKTAGFTGTRCGYTVVPHALRRGGASLNKLWLRRQTTKFNGVPYIVQRGAEAVFGCEGKAQIRADIAYYAENAKRIAETMRRCGIWFTGGANSPYIWFACPPGVSSWEFFDKLLDDCGIVGTPGAGFGACGEGFFRFTAFATHERTALAMEKFEKLLTTI